MSTTVTNNKSRWLAAGLAVVLLVAGAAIGVSVDRLWVRGSSSPPDGHWQRHSPEQVMRWFRDKLDLTDEQATKIEAIFHDTRRRAHEATQHIRPQLRHIHMQAQKRVLELLEPDQAEQYKKLIEHKQRHFRHMHKPHH